MSEKDETRYVVSIKCSHCSRKRHCCPCLKLLCQPLLTRSFLSHVLCLNLSSPFDSSPPTDGVAERPCRSVLGLVVYSDQRRCLELTSEGIRASRMLWLSQTNDWLGETFMHATPAQRESSASSGGCQIASSLVNEVSSVVVINLAKCVDRLGARPSQHGLVSSRAHPLNVERAAQGWVGNCEFDRAPLNSLVLYINTHDAAPRCKHGCSPALATVI
jgi:hypothetical protein